MIPCDWNDDISARLASISSNIESLRARVFRGDSQLWRVESPESCGYVVTEIFPDLLFLWCYCGSGFVPLSRRLARIALDNGLSRIGWFTYHDAPRRVFRECRGEWSTTDIPGEQRFILNAEDVWQLSKTLPERLRLARLAVMPQLASVPLRPA